MAIYKLGDILIDKPEYGASLSGLKNGKYRYFTQSDIGKCENFKFVNKTLGKIMKKDDFFISRAGTILPYIHESNEPYVFAGYLVRYPLNDKICIPKFLYYWFNGNVGSEEIKKNSRTGSTMPKMNPPVATNLKINIPPIQEQQKIIDIIEPIEKLYLKYSNCVRIDSYEFCKMDLKKIIDIIEPIENLKIFTSNIQKIFLKLIKNLETLNTKKEMSCYLEPIRYKPKNINQISAKVIESNTGNINDYEKKGTYKTNSFYAPSQTFVFCSIRTYLKKWAILPYEADVNGTLFQFLIKNNLTPLISFLLNDESWKQFSILSKGTKMPVINLQDFLKIEFNDTKILIPNVELIFIKMNQIIMKLREINKCLILLLIN